MQMWGDTGQRGNCNCIRTIPVHDSHRMGKATVITVTTTTIRFYHYEGIIYTENQLNCPIIRIILLVYVYICMYVFFFNQ